MLDTEARAIQFLKQKIGESFVRAVDLLNGCTGKVIVIGIGKSGIVAQKIASTFSCSGTPAFFLHPAEGIHGDIGMMSKSDVALAVSNSGETREIIQILPVIKRWGIPLIVMTGNVRSVLAQSGEVVLDTGVPEEACPLGLVPTSKHHGHPGPWRRPGHGPAGEAGVSRRTILPFSIPAGPWAESCCSGSRT